MHEIKLLVYKCEVYMDKHLEDHQDKKEEGKVGEGTAVNKNNLTAINEDEGEKLNES